MSKIQKLVDAGRHMFSRADIEMFGMFGPGNLGDEAMLVAARRVLGDDRIMPWMAFPSRPWLDQAVNTKTRAHLLVGGGTLIHGGDTFWLDHVEKRVAQGMQLSAFGTGIAFMDHQIAERTGPYTRWSRLLQGARHVWLRGPMSVDVAAGMGVTAQVFGDFAFLLHGADLPPATTERSGFGINVGHCLDGQPDFEARMARAVKLLAAEGPLTFYLVVADDLAATRRIIEAADLPAGSYAIESHFFDPLAYMDAVRRHRAMIALKMHAAGLAMVVGMPTVMIAYKPKCHDFMAPLSDGDQALTGLDFVPEELVAQALALEGGETPSRIERSIAALAQTQRQVLSQAF